MSRPGDLPPCPACGGSMRFCECMDDPFAPAGRKCQTCGCGSDGDGDCPCGCINSEGVGTGAGEGATGQDIGTAWVTRSADCPEAPAQAHPLGPDGFTPLAPASTCSTCGCGVAGDGDCPCGCVEAAERTREAFALGAAWALGDDEEAPAALRDRIEQVSAERDRYRMAWKSAVTRAGLAAERAETAEAEVERLLDVLAEVRRAFDLQCPPDVRRSLHVDRGAWMAHSWWNTVLGGILNREAER